ncbi:hypothetical protein BJ138DRAFT_1172225 [Hygrophoropsis aurantiaca]|uniref:Uncharacterized protein n=1 Tax=Hygrophoropsis aurantiaca TaxID=72124 RepID=A0ACB8AF08_9AGAM|nr:hypothetical protein BJ138DRAFT_1172225 [Hygrophoropsis aurantiaca]
MSTSSDDELVPEVKPATLKISTYVTGICLLLIVVILWTASNFITQNLFVDGGYQKPFLVTYTNTASFAFYLLPFFLRRYWRKTYGRKSSPEEVYQSLTQDANEIDDATVPALGIKNSDDAPFTIKETAKLAFMFCFLWFGANWALNVALGYTSVASATILSSMSGFFTLGIGRLFRVETLTLVKICAVLTSFIGVTLVSLSDSHSEQQPGAGLAPVESQMITSMPVLGDFLAILSAILYAVYVIFLKVQIRDESRIDMQLFFGFVGFFNIFLCWPMGVVLHLIGLERFELPGTNKAIIIILLNMVITLSSDFLYVLAMLRTTPLVVTVGLSLTIPLAVIGDFLLGKSAATMVVLGALLVLAAFIIIGLEDSKTDGGKDLISDHMTDDIHRQQAQLRLEEEVPLQSEREEL